MSADMGSAKFETEELMDAFLSELTPGTTVMIKEGWECRWCPGTDIAKYFGAGAGSNEDIYWYSKNKVWQLIPAF